MFLENGVPKICCKFTGEHLCRRVISIKLQKQASAWVFSCKFAAYFQNSLYLWVAASNAKKPEIYLGPYQTSIIEIFEKIGNGFTYFCKKLHHRYFIRS